MDQTARTMRFGEAFCRVLTRASQPEEECDAPGLGDAHAGGPGASGAAAGPRLTPTQLECLRYVATHPDCLVKDVAQGLRVSHPAATKLVDRLAARGVLARLPGTTDRREVHLRLTAAGEKALGAARRVQERSLGRILERMGPADRSALQAGLEAFLRAALRTAADVEAVCGHCGTEHTPACPIDALYRELTGKAMPTV